MIKWHGVLPVAEIADNLFTVIGFKVVQKFRKSSDSFFRVVFVHPHLDLPLLP